MGEGGGSGDSDVEIIGVKQKAAHKARKSNTLANFLKMGHGNTTVKEPTYDSDQNSKNSLPEPKKRSSNKDRSPTQTPEPSSQRSKRARYANSEPVSEKSKTAARDEEVTEQIVDIHGCSPLSYTHHGFGGFYPIPQLSRRLLDVTVDGSTTQLDSHALMSLLPPVRDANDQPTPSQNEIKAGAMAGPETRFQTLKCKHDRKCTAGADGFIKFVEKSSEELDQEVEYDMDEEDMEWLKMVNAERLGAGEPVLTTDQLEMLIDRIEKLSFKHGQALGHGQQLPADEDAVCTICGDGDSEQGNVILFCDNCNMAVHQDCYGVHFIPEGQWLCRRCQISPSKPVECELCPYRTGAFKQTDDGKWVHVICALWVPEVQFANESILEPITNIADIPKARWKLTCYVCGKKGACIQCQVKTCCTAYHPTCAQKIRLHMKMGIEDKMGKARNVSYCDAHSPEGWGPIVLNAPALKAEMRVSQQEAVVMTIPTVPVEDVLQLLRRMSIPVSEKLAERLVAYWLQKRHSRSGVPLIRRLQDGDKTDERGDALEDTEDQVVLKEQVKKLRTGLERLRLLAELVMKRERSRRDLVRVHRQLLLMRVMPLVLVLRQTLYQLRKLDTRSIFLDPVDTVAVADYLDVITHPMDFSTMGKKLEGLEYTSLEAFFWDFVLVCANAMKYNAPETIYYREAAALFRRGSLVIQEARQRLQGLHLDASTGMVVPNPADGADGAALSAAFEARHAEIGSSIPTLEQLGIPVRGGHQIRRDSRKLGQPGPLSFVGPVPDMPSDTPQALKAKLAHAKLQLDKAATIAKPGPRTSTENHWRARIADLERRLRLVSGPADAQAGDGDAAEQQKGTPNGQAASESTANPATGEQNTSPHKPPPSTNTENPPEHMPSTPPGTAEANFSAQLDESLDSEEKATLLSKWREHRAARKRLRLRSQSDIHSNGEEGHSDEDNSDFDAKVDIESESDSENKGGNEGEKQGGEVETTVTGSSPTSRRAWRKRKRTSESIEKGSGGGKGSQTSCDDQQTTAPSITVQHPAGEDGGESEQAERRRFPEENIGEGEGDRGENEGRENESPLDTSGLLSLHDPESRNRALASWKRKRRHQHDGNTDRAPSPPTRRKAAKLEQTESGETNDENGTVDDAADNPSVETPQKSDGESETRSPHTLRKRPSDTRGEEESSSARRATPRSSSRLARSPAHSPRSPRSPSPRAGEEPESSPRNLRSGKRNT